MVKIISWITLNGASILGIVQAVIKFIKELLTLCLNQLVPIMPNDKFKAMIEKARGFINVVDGWVEKVKGYLVK
jgi:hypothetical protein